jgi:hypothetical protein
MTSDLVIFEEPHHQALELLSLQALASGDIATAFRLSDRRCRIKPLPEPHCYVLRGDALFRMGEKQAALGGIVRAIEIIRTILRQIAGCWHGATGLASMRRLLR